MSIDYPTISDAVKDWKQLTGVGIKRYKLYPHEIFDIINELESELTDEFNAIHTFATDETKERIKKKVEMEIPNYLIKCELDINSTGAIDRTSLVTGLDFIISDPNEIKLILKLK